MFKNLRKAQDNPKDEFYTRLVDIEKELKNYKDKFKNKVIYCNCDNPEYSNFWKYFYNNFKVFQLKKLVATFFSKDGVSYKTEFDEVNKKKTSLLENGDFRGEECQSVLAEANIVITNPPFSLFRDFISILTKNNKDFIIIGNTNALTYSEVFSLFMQNKIRTGYTNFNTGMYFVVPKGYKYSKIIDGQKCARVSSSCWYTSLPVNKTNKELLLTKKYNPKDYPTYHNYNAININNFHNIPYNYDGIMGVPITFLDKYNPEQFELLGLSSKQHSQNIPRFHDNSFYNGYTRGKVVTRIESNLPLLDVPNYGGTKCTKENCPDLYQLYWRIFIKKIK